MNIQKRKMYKFIGQASPKENLKVNNKVMLYVTIIICNSYNTSRGQSIYKTEWVYYNCFVV